MSDDDVWTLTTEQVEQLMACPIEIPGCVADTGDICDDDPCEHDYVKDTICAECAQSNTVNPDDHDEGCSKRAILRAALARPEPAGDVVDAGSIAAVLMPAPPGDADGDRQWEVLRRQNERILQDWLSKQVAAALRDAAPEAVRRWREWNATERARLLRLLRSSHPYGIDTGPQHTAMWAVAADALEALAAEPADGEREP